MITEIVRALVASGASPDMILAAVEAAEAMERGREEKRLTAQRERSRRYRQRNVTPRDETLLNVTERDDTLPNVASQTLSLSPSKEIPPTPPKETQPLSLSIADVSAREVSKDEEYELKLAAGKSLSASPNLFVMAIPMQWKAAGMDWAMDVLPAVRAASVNSKPGRVQSWGYFTQAIADHHAKRTQPMPEGNGAQNARSPRRTTASVMREVADEARRREDERDSGSSFSALAVVPGTRQ